MSQLCPLAIRGMETRLHILDSNDFLFLYLPHFLLPPKHALWNPDALALVQALAKCEGSSYAPFGARLTATEFVGSDGQATAPDFQISRQRAQALNRNGHAQDRARRRQRRSDRQSL